MKKHFFLLALLITSSNAFAQWQPVGDKIKTRWAETIDPANVLPEYPRPMMERSEWTNLNGLWEYAIRPVGQNEPAQFDGKILVPFAVESSLSGVQKAVGKNNELWYKRTLHIPAKWENKTLLLHFGAVDWQCDIFLNDIKIGSHRGGYTPFSINITPYLVKSSAQKLVVKVWDPTTDGYQPVGKQRTIPEGIWYTPVSGIWQTVWIEPLNTKYITAVKSVPDIDAEKLSIDVAAWGATEGDVVEVVVKDGNVQVAKAKAALGQRLNLTLAKPKLWSPESPFLYDVEIALYEKNMVQDRIKSYAAMRKIATQRDNNGVVRLQLNNTDYFQLGTLDQGWWPDGLYTAPTDEALAFDIQKTKDLGFNMIRKHVKVEPARWYTHCDRLGILVWQDMPSGDRSTEWQMKQYFNGTELVRTAESEANFRREWKEIMDLLASHPSIVAWVPFNEAWGQFKTQEIAEWTKAHDPSRLVNSASGGNHYLLTGDMLDIHHYPDPQLYLYDTCRATVLGEFGGIGMPVKNHLWQADQNWGYVQFKTPQEVTDEYIKYAEILKKLIKDGFSAAIYTQTTDVEGEVNGLMTYDRKVVKVEEARVRKINREICNSLILINKP